MGGIYQLCFGVFVSYVLVLAWASILKKYAEQIFTGSLFPEKTCMGVSFVLRFAHDKSV